MVRAGVQVRAVVRVVRPLDRTNYSVQRAIPITRGTTLFLTKAVMVNYLIFPDRYDHRLNRVEDPK